jgi:hypothetical protein
MNSGSDKNKARARELADSLRDRNSPPSIDAMNRIYDVVLNMNSLNSKPSDGRFYDPSLIMTVDISSMLKEEKERKKKEIERTQEMYAPRGMPPPPPPPPFDMMAAPMMAMAMAAPIQEESMMRSRRAPPQMKMMMDKKAMAPRSMAMAMGKIIF